MAEKKQVLWSETAVIAHIAKAARCETIRECLGFHASFKAAWVSVCRTGALRTRCRVWGN